MRQPQVAHGWTCLNSTGQSTIHKRFQDMQEKGIWEILFKSIIRLAYRQKKFSVKKIAVDSTTIPDKKRDEKIGYDGNKKILGTKINVNHIKRTANINYAQSCKQS